MVLNDEEAALIYGLEYPARAMCAQTSAQSELMPIRFLVGTQSLRNNNQVHVIEYVEDCGGQMSSDYKYKETGNSNLTSSGLKKVILKHPGGEIWDISCHSKHPNLMATCHANSSQDNNFNYVCSLWESPVDLASTTLDEDGGSGNSLTKLQEFSISNASQEIDTNLMDNVGTRRSLWHPDDASQLLTMECQKLLLWDVENKSLLNQLSVNCSEKSFQIMASRWSPHSNCAIVGLAIGKQLYAKDLRCNDSSSFAWTIPNAHSDTIRDLDFNPNAQYHVVSCGDDCEYKFWDVRNSKTPSVVMRSQHSHWIWSVRYNQYHDQLVLSCSSDSRVVLSRIASFASQPFGHLMDDNDSSSDENANNEEEDAESTKQIESSDFDSNTISDEEQEFKKRKSGRNEENKSVKKDEVVSIYDEHEDSVYAVEWSNADPWVFASISYDGRFVLNRVPKTEKYSLLI